MSFPKHHIYSKFAKKMTDQLSGNHYFVTDTSSSQQVVIRQCATVPRNTRPGTCSHETTGSSISIDFCEYCDYDGCNGATGLQKGLLAVLIPALLLLFLRK